MASFAIVVTGTLVIVLGQIIVKFFIDPVHDLYRLKGEIADTLIFYAREYTNPGVLSKEHLDEAQAALRQRGCQLMSRMHGIPAYWAWQFFHVVPRRTAVREAWDALVGLSNSVHEGDASQNVDRRQKIQRALGIKTE